MPGDNLPLVSIIVPMYNEERYIGKCLDSILAQDFDMSQCEILVIDGRSTDRSAEIVRERAARDPRIRLLDNPDRILPAGINVGIRHSRAPFLLKMDSHCEYYDDYVKEAVKCFQGTGAHNIAGLFIAKPGADTRMAQAIHLVQASRFGAGASYGRQPGPARFVGDNEHVTSGWSFRKDLFDKIGLFDVRLVRNHDNDLSYRAYEAGLGVYFNPAVRAAYVSRSDLSSFARVMYRNGLYLTPLWRIRPGTFSIMHTAPLVFLLAVVVGCVGGLLWWPLSLIGAIALVPYAILDVMLTIGLAAKHGWYLLAFLPWLFPVTHLAYGLGTLVGLVRFGLRKLPPNPNPPPNVAAQTAAGPATA